MESIGPVLGVIAAILVYRHTSGKATYNRVFVFALCLLSLLPCLIATMIGWHHNPRRDAGDSWKTVI